MQNVLGQWCPKKGTCHNKPATCVSDHCGERWWQQVMDLMNLHEFPCVSLPFLSFQWIKLGQACQDTCITFTVSSSGLGFVVGTKSRRGKYGPGKIRATQGLLILHFFLFRTQGPTKFKTMVESWKVMSLHPTYRARARPGHNVLENLAGMVHQKLLHSQQRGLFFFCLATKSANALASKGLSHRTLVETFTIHVQVNLNLKDGSHVHTRFMVHRSSLHLAKLHWSCWSKAWTWCCLWLEWKIMTMPIKLIMQSHSSGARNVDTVHTLTMCVVRDSQTVLNAWHSKQWVISHEKALQHG